LGGGGGVSLFLCEGSGLSFERPNQSIYRWIIYVLVCVNRCLSCVCVIWCHLCV